MVKYIFSKVLDVLGKKPFRLWGMSLLTIILIGLASAFGILPIISVPIALVLQLGMVTIYLAGYRGQEFNSDTLFSGFKDFWRCAGGMAWMSLWMMIWACVPVYGIIKAYSYRFTPYILSQDKDISATQALRKSMEMTKGYKGKMFVADLLVFAAIFACSLVLGLLSLIPYVGILFTILLVLVGIVFSLVLPLVLGLVQAAFYDEVNSGSDESKYTAYAAQKEMEKQLKEQMKAQMEAQMEQLRQQQLAQMQQQAQQQADATLPKE